MRGITNAPQGGGSGGEWIEHSDTDWSDFISYANSSFTFLKDVRFKIMNKSYNNAIMWTDVEIPAGTTFSSLKIPVSQGYFAGGANNIEFGKYFELYSSNITDANVRLHMGRLSVSGSDLTLTDVPVSTWSKSNIKVYTKG